MNQPNEVIEQMARMIRQQHGMGEQYQNLVLSRLSEEVINYVSLSHKYKSGELAQAWYEIVDEAIKKYKEDYPDSQLITCEKGCSSCCKISVCISQAEAELIIDYCEQWSVPTYPAILRQQRGNTSSTWKDLPIKYRNCIFLSQHGTCRIYDVRPSACRQHFSVSEKEFCNMTRFPEGKIKIWRPLEIEYIAVAQTIAGDCSFLPEKLLEVIEGRNGNTR
jgi:Fe-S-cluster containining protein